MFNSPPVNLCLEVGNETQKYDKIYTKNPYFMCQSAFKDFSSRKVKKGSRTFWHFGHRV